MTPRILFDTVHGPTLDAIEGLVIHNPLYKHSPSCNCLFDSHPVAVFMFDRAGTQCTTPKGIPEAGRGVDLSPQVEESNGPRLGCKSIHLELE